MVASNKLHYHFFVAKHYNIINTQHVQFQYDYYVSITYSITQLNNILCQRIKLEYEKLTLLRNRNASE